MNFDFNLFPSVINFLFTQSGKTCAEFNIGVGRVIEDDSKECAECPDKYPSYESFLCKELL